jgi:beta-N-acetylhexosaminidase
MTQTLKLPRGPVMVGVAGLTLTDAECQTLSHPLVGGVILFRRNYQSLEQLAALTARIKSLRTPALLIAVDHEGGRVQRFLDGFTRLPPMSRLGARWDEDRSAALEEARTVGYVLAAELRACDIDLSFTPVLDLNWGPSAVIGNRAFGAEPEKVAALAEALQQGLRQGGMASCGKHFPGHGWVSGDSHHEIPRDTRPLEEIRRNDLQPFARLVASGMASLMPAHVVYPAVDAQPAGYSRRWLQDILRAELKFDGVIFSDDLGMEGAAGAGGIVDRARAAFSAGCDVVLLCNRPDFTAELLRELPAQIPAALAARLARIEGDGERAAWQATIASADFAACRRKVAALVPDEQSMRGVSVGEAN